MFPRELMMPCISPCWRVRYCNCLAMLVIVVSVLKKYNSNILFVQLIMLVDHFLRIHESDMSVVQSFVFFPFDVSLCLEF